MRYCHEQGVLHGDLTAGNVMLMGQPAAGPGQRDFTAKVRLTCRLPGHCQPLSLPPPVIMHGMALH
jgi:hypothetical protein